MIGNLDALLNLSNDIFQKKEIKSLLSELGDVAGYLWNRGWAERNAGNFSVNVTALFTDRELERLAGYPFQPLSRQYSGTGRTLYLMSATGTRMRDLAANPAENVCFVFISPSETAYHIITCGEDSSSLKPTSELATHLAIQQMLMRDRPTASVVLHAHVTQLIALTHLEAFRSEETINALLWGMHPETILFIRNGIGYLPFMVPGTDQIAAATVRKLGNHDAVLWENHGCLAIGPTPGDAFDILDLLAKQATLYFLCRSAGKDPAGLSRSQLEEICAHYPL
jgi:rhamnulose-1-phosphate aldolase